MKYMTPHFMLTWPLDNLLNTQFFLFVRISKLFNHISHFQAKVQNAENIPRKHYLDSF